jgi:sortase A
MRRAIGAVGRALVTIGILILLFVVYQLWGTGIYEAQQQDQLKSQFAQDLRSNAATSTTAPAGPTTTTTPPPPPPSGDAVAVIRIPKIGVDNAVVQGTGVPDLRRGPGHYPLTPLPGQLGNAAIAGHRTTYGAPFNRLDELGVGDPILVTTLTGTYRYLMTEQLIVSPKEVSVLDPTRGASLTLTTCNPKYSASQRLIVKAALDTDRSPAPTKAPKVTKRVRQSLEDGLSGTTESTWPTFWWALALAAVGGLWWLVFHRYHRWTTWVVGVIPFSVILFFFYFHLERVLPSNY